MDIYRFRQFPVYKDVRQLRKELKELSRNKFPNHEQFCLTSQLWRALDSVLLNIAEGTDRYSDLDFSRFLNNSLTSVNEVIACLDAALDDQYVSEKEHQEYLKKTEQIVKQLKALISKVRKDSKSF